MTEYERYLRVPELLSLQKPPAERAHPDELLFQCTHQSAELWMKVIVDELDRARGLMEGGDDISPLAPLQRAARMQQFVAEQILILETLSPLDYHAIRRVLGRGSGSESPGFRRILTQAPKLLPPFRGLLQKAGLTVLDLLQKPGDHRDLYNLLQAMLEFDAWFQRFRYNHYTLARRIIGLDAVSLKGAPAQVLELGIKELMFQELWDVVTELTNIEWPASY